MISFIAIATSNTIPFLQVFTAINSMGHFLSFHSLSEELEQVTFSP